MLAYLILAGRNGAPVDPDLIARFDREDPPEVPFHPESRILWRNHDSSVVFFGWQAFTQVAGIGSHWAVDEQGITAFAGHCWPKETGWDHRSGKSWATQLREFLGDPPDLLAARETIYGQYTLIRLSGQGPGAVVSDFASMHQLYFAEHGSSACVSNRAALCAQFVTAPGTIPKRSLIGAGWLIGEGWVLDHESGYWDVERPLFESYVAIDHTHGARLLELPRSPFVTGEEAGRSRDHHDTLDEVERDLRSTIRAIAALPVPDREFWLSGGKDSRMLLGIILSEGLASQFHFVTQGAPERADVQVARMLAKRFRLDWRRVDYSGHTPERELEKTRRHTGLAEAMSSSWNASPTFDITPGVSLTGDSGESLHRDVVATYCGADPQTESALVANMQQKHEFDRLGVIRPEARTYYQGFLSDWVRDRAVDGRSLERIAAQYTYGLLGYARTGPTFTWSPRLTLTPFITPTCAFEHHRPGRSQWPDWRLPIDLIRRCSVELSKLPFAATPWREAEIAHLPDVDDYRTIEPVVNRSPAARTWRQQRYPDYRPFIEQIVLDRANPIHELLDYDRLIDRLATGDEHPGRTRLIWGVLTAAIWMGQHELSPKLTRE